MRGHPEQNADPTVGVKSWRVGTSSWRGAIGVLLVVALAGCGSRVSPDPGGDRAAVATREALSTDPAHRPGVLLPSAAPSAPHSMTPVPLSVRPSPTTSPNFGSKHNNGNVKLALSATCVSPGSWLIVTITTPPKAALAMVVGYSDDEAHGAMLTGEADASGNYVWRVAVEPTVPEGVARVLVSATGANGSQEGGGTADKTFHVSRSGC